MKKKEYVKAWQPVRRGRLYCSPACGAGCTHAQYLEAKKKGAALLKKVNGSGWKVEVTENMGWHYNIQHKVLGISVHETFYGERASYFICGPCSLVDYATGSDGKKYGPDPNKLLRRMRDRLKKHYQNLAEALTALDTPRKGKK